MFSKPITLFKILGFDIRADSSWIFISIFISWTLSTSLFPSQFPGYDSLTYQHMAIWSLVGLIFSILVHELAHAIIAEHYQMPIISIRLFIFGGVAEMKGAPSHPKGELYMALAGPVMSFILGLLFWQSHAFWGFYFGPGPIEHSLQYLGYINFILALFNIVPAFPLDGGRALRAYLWLRKRNLVIATRIASDLGEIFAYMLMAYGCYRLMYFDDIIAAAWVGLLGIFMLGAGRYAVRQSESWSLLSGQTVADFMDADFMSVSPDMTISDFVDQYLYKHYQPSFPVIDEGKLVGIISVHSIMETDRKKWGWMHVRSQMQPAAGINTVSHLMPAADALDMMRRLAQTSLLVTDEGKLVGILSITDIINYLSITMKLDRNRIIKNSEL